MDENSTRIYLSEIQETESPDQSHPEVQALMSRLLDIEPMEMAKALYNLESRKTFSYLYLYSPDGDEVQTDLMFSQGLKDEIESIYLELAQHLRSKSVGSVDLMNAVFDFFSETMGSITKVPWLISNN